MDIRTWQGADRPDLPEPGFDDDSVFPGVPGVPGTSFPDPARAPYGAADASFTAADVISLGPAVRPGPRGSRSVYSARHRSARSPFSPLRPAPIAIGSLSTAAIAAFAFVGPGMLHGGDATSTMPVLDGMPHRIAPLTPGSDAAPGSASTDQSSAAPASPPGAPTSTATGATTTTAPTNSAAAGPGGHGGATSPSGPGDPTSPGTGTPTGPGHPVTPPTPPASDPSQPPTNPPTSPPTGQPTPPPSAPWGPVSPPTTPPPSQPTPPPTSSPAPPVFNASAAVSSALTEISQARTSQGADALAVDPVLVQAASKHTGDMVRSGRFSHTGSDGSTPYSRAQALGCWTLSKELIARGRPGDDVVGALLKNAQSRPALLSYLNSTIGISAQQDPKTGDVYWTIELAWL
ncbi:CAP domain-containing protein [Catenulispora subtropica]|uniref:SCP domain-containing protein n=1 Tax=Catenulispora subtropica TaxID=450798 RepID=A0ABP5DBD4_9ACTN